MFGRFQVRFAGLAIFAAVLALAAPRAGAAAVTHFGPASFTVRGSAEQVDVTNAPAGRRLTLLGRGGERRQTRTVNRLGGLLFRNVTPGSGYRVREAIGQSGVQSPTFTVLSTGSAPPSAKIYHQRIPASGYGYLTTRDGTKLAIDVRLPSGKGPFPTLIEYSGYGYADPAGAQSGLSKFVAPLLGFVVVDVNMRGTGCSGGAFDFFERLQSLDGYDVIETVARQPWVLHHKVGMMGISYGGISQLFVAETNPPSLAAIAPLSVIDHSSTTLLYAGGILNTGFVLPWATERVHDAMPASSTGGQPWALQRIQQGDATCQANQALHPEAVNLVAKIAADRYYRPAVADPVDPITFVDKIKSPVYLACQFNDEQTGAHCPDLAQHFTGTARKWFTFTNGYHIDSLDPATLMRMYDFLELFVAHRAPRLPPVAKAAASLVFKTAMGVNGVVLPSDPIQAEPSYGAALAAFEQLPSVRILFDDGAGSATPGNPVAAFEQSFPRFPLPGTFARSWYLGAEGTLGGARAATAAADRFTWTKSALPPTDFTGDTSAGTGGLWTALPHYHWDQNPPGTALSYLTPRLGANTVVVGGGALQVWIRSSTPDVDLQVTVSEVRPDGKETFVQNGWMRASDRALDPVKSTLLAPVPSFRQVDVAPLPKGRFTEVTVPLYYQGHVYRAGSRIRIVVASPEGAQPVWAFADTMPSGTASVSLAHSPMMPSRLILPVVPGVRVPTGLPPCPGLRGEPCRAYQPLVNRSGSL